MNIHYKFLRTLFLSIVSLFLLGQPIALAAKKPPSVVLNHPKVLDEDLVKPFLEDLKQVVVYLFYVGPEDKPMPRIILKPAGLNLQEFEKKCGGKPLSPEQLREKYITVLPLSEVALEKWLNQLAAEHQFTDTTQDRPGEHGTYSIAIVSPAHRWSSTRSRARTALLLKSLLANLAPQDQEARSVLSSLKNRLGFPDL